MNYKRKKNDDIDTDNDNVMASISGRIEDLQEDHSSIS